MVGKGGASVLLLPFALVHIHIYSKLRFPIKTLPSNPLSCLMGQKKRGFWLSFVNCGGFPLRLSIAAFESGAHQMHLLSWVSKGLLLLGSTKSDWFGANPIKNGFWHSAVMNGTWFLVLSADVSASTKSCFAWSCEPWHWRHSHFSYSFALTEWVIC